MGRKVCVLMSSYNGEKYIKEQIDSILAQEEVEIYLLIRDDGSRDATLDILEKYEKLDNVSLIKGENLGVKKSFLSLIAMAPDYFDYYALSDQDDYWLTDKMISAINHIEGAGENLDDNFLYYSNTCLVDENLFPLNEKGYNVDRPYNFGEILIRNCASGCTYVFGRKLKSLIQIRRDVNIEKIPMHDHWINMICLATGGKIIFEKKSHILYRQHGENAIGNKRTLYVKIRNSSLLNKNDKRYNYCFQLYFEYKDYLSEVEKKKLKRVIDYKNSFKDTVRLAFDREIKPRGFVQKIVVTLSVLRRSF
jgi:rhamnosyltransferase